MSSLNVAPTGRPSATTLGRRHGKGRIARLGIVVALSVALISGGGVASAPSAQASQGVVSAQTVSAAPIAAVTSVGAPTRAGAVPALNYRPGAAWGQIDILMDEYETAMVAKSLWGGSVVCWPAAVAGFAGGVAGSMGAFGACITMATVCAARAYLSQPRKRAAITITVWGYGWCWKY